MRNYTNLEPPDVKGISSEEAAHTRLLKEHKAPDKDEEEEDINQAFLKCCILNFCSDYVNEI